MAVFALEINGGWVQLRKATKPPVPNISRVVREIVVPAALAAKLEISPNQKLEIKQISFTGGKPLAIMSKGSFANLYTKLNATPAPPVSGTKVVNLGVKAAQVLETLKASRLTYYLCDNLAG